MFTHVAICRASWGTLSPQRQNKLPRLARASPVPSWRMGPDRRFFDDFRCDPGASLLLREWLTGRGELVPEDVHNAIWGFVPWTSMSLDDRLRELRRIQDQVRDLL